MTTNNLRVLVVDDDRDGADTLGMVVEELGNQVNVAYGGTQALDVASAFRPDLMLIDLEMPQIDGCGLVGRFRQNPNFAQTRIVAITGHSDEAHKSSAMKAGFNMVYFKPITLQAIEAVLASVLAFGPAEQAARLPERASLEAIGESAIPASTLHEKPIVLVVDDEKAVGTMLALALQHNGFVVRLATTGRQAVEIYRQHYKSIALVLMDVQMPGIDGPATLTAIQTINPDVRCCFMSGHTGNYAAQELLDLGAVRVLPKPFASLGLLTRLLWDMVGARVEWTGNREGGTGTIAG
jgi:CheY-like chemotaxis protein